MNKARKYLVIVFVLLLIVSMLSACGTSSSSADMYAAGSTQGLNLIESALDSNSFGGSAHKSTPYSEDAYYDYDYNYESEIVNEVSDDENNSSETDQKLVYTSNLSIETKDMTSALQTLHTMIDNHGGIIQSEDLSDMDTIYRDPEYYYNGYRMHGATGKIYVRIPQKNFVDFINGLYEQEGILYITSSSKSIENMTDKYYDTSNYLKTLRIEQERLQSFLEEAKTVQDMLTVESRLTEVQYKIESCMNTLQTIDYDVNYAKVTIIIKEVLKYTEPPEEQLTLIQRLKGYIEDSGEDFADFLEGFVMVIIHIIPFVLFFGVVIIVIVVCYKRYRCKHPKKEKIYCRQKSKGTYRKNETMTNVNLVQENNIAEKSDKNN